MLTRERESESEYSLPNSNLAAQLESLPTMVAGVWSDDTSLQLEATRQFCEMLSLDVIPIEEVIRAGVVPRFVEFLAREECPKLQLNAVSLLTNIASGTSENTKVVIDHGAVPIFVMLLSSPSDDIREQAVWALGNVAVDSLSCRDLVLNHGVLVPLLAQLNEHAKLSMLRIATCTLAILCRGNPEPSFEQVRPAVPALGRLIFSNDEEVLTEACWALSYLSVSNGPKGQIQALIEAGVCPQLVQLLGHPSRLVLIPALCTVSNISMGDGMHVQCLINHGALPCLLNLLTHQFENSILREACWAISSFTAGDTEQKQAVIDAGLIAPLVSLLENAELDIQKEAAWALSNASYGTPEQIKYLISQGCIKPLCELLICPDPAVINVCLDALGNILVLAEKEKRLGNSGYAQMIEDAEVFGKFRDLLRHDNSEIREMAVDILNWLEEEADEQ
ncbi:hypothetical protein RJT34_29883 [Clitoria ternatea]|uniref:Importin subunit alpha n=1 Tax=Clitoria ternatea TaxID=43366 RepID=A0AAN9I6T6_CLITE